MMPLDPAEDAVGAPLHQLQASTEEPRSSLSPSPPRLVSLPDVPGRLSQQGLKSRSKSHGTTDMEKLRQVDSHKWCIHSECDMEGLVCWKLSDMSLSELCTIPFTSMTVGSFYVRLTRQPTAIRKL